MAALLLSAVAMTTAETKAVSSPDGPTFLGC